MNTICSIRKEHGVWRVEAETPEGTRLVVSIYGTYQQAVQEALQAEAEPA